ncbi:MAG: molybdate ABC transporter substrate-binding protein [Epsilonproteobacteria bacterium]|nr:molybdate ABC transporter substrate-binding protein [Campylobacterota bacterium]MBD3839293.1 molybdate ABC transporter substrate-binding protein [Campylobacterota bacterium]
MKLSTLVLSLLASVTSAFADTANIAAASDLKYAFDDMKILFVKKYPNHSLNFQFGSSGKALTQISNGAPYDVYFAADMNYPKQLKEKGLAVGVVKPYALGRVGVATLKNSKIKITKISDLLNPKIQKIAIANPEHAPYGRAAKEALESYGVYDKIKSKLVYGENISQTTQFIQSGSADVGIIALSIAKAPIVAKEINFGLIDGKKHKDIIQGYALLTHGKDNMAAKNFMATVESSEGNKIMAKYGFIVK